MYDEHIEHGCKRECGQGTLSMYTVCIYLTKVNIKLREKKQKTKNKTTKKQQKQQQRNFHSI